MILDDRTEFCDATAVNTGGAGNYTLGDQIDLGASQRRDLGGDQALYCVVSVATGLVGTSGNITFQVVSADDAALTTNPTVHVQSAAFSTTAGSATTTLAPGTVLMSVQLPRDFYRRYVGIRQVTAVAATSAGAIDAFLTQDVAAWRSYDAPFQL
jgi:hypothetical protein